MSRLHVVAAALLLAGVSLVVRADDQSTASELGEAAEVSPQSIVDEAAAYIRSGQFGLGEAVVTDYAPRSVNRERIEAALEKSVHLEFIDTEFYQVVQFLAERYQIPIIPDEQAVSKAGDSFGIQVNLIIRDISLRNALELILEPWDLDYVFANDVLKITTRDRAERLVETRVYDLRRLSDEYTPQEMANVIQRTIRPDEWTPRIVAEMSALGVIEYRQIPDASQPAADQSAAAAGTRRAAIEPLAGCLVITQSQRAHREIAAFLSQFERFVANDPERSDEETAAARPAETLQLKQAARQIIRLNVACLSLQAELLDARCDAEQSQQALKLSIQRSADQHAAEVERLNRTIERLDQEVLRLRQQ